MISAKILRSFLVAFVPLYSGVICFGLLRYLARFWHPDAERSEPRVRYAQRLLVGCVLSAVGCFLVLSRHEFRDAWGLFPTLRLNLGFHHLAALILGLAVLLYRTRSYRDWPTLAAVPVAVVAAVILAPVGCPKSSRYAWLGLAISALPLWWFRRFRLFTPEQQAATQDWISELYNRGAFLTPLPWVNDIAARQIGISSSLPIYFGFQWMPIEAAEGHFLFAGASGSGKSILFRLMMQSVFRRFAPGSNERAVVFDAKHEHVSILQGLGVGRLVRILNPFDRRCVVWDVARDFDSPAGALKLAKLLLPDDDKDRDPFWRDSARGLIADVIRAHILALRDGIIPTWNLTAIIRALGNLEDIRRALALHPDTADALRNIPEEKTLSNVLATVDLVRREFEVLAALWEEPARDPARCFSLTDWMQHSEILVLGPSAVAEEVIHPLNRLILDRLGQLILDSAEHDRSRGTNPTRTWLFLDEFPRLGRMDRIENLMTNGRSKGLVAVLGIQEISDLREIYKPNYAITITGACTHKVLLQAPSPEHAEWSAQVIGSQEVLQIATTRSVGDSGGTANSQTSRAPSEKEKALFTKDEFLYLGKPGERTPLRHMPSWLPSRRSWPVLRDLYRFFATSFYSPLNGCCCVQGRAYRASLPFTGVIEALAPRAGSDLQPRPVAEQFLRRLEALPPAAVGAEPARIADSMAATLWTLSGPDYTPTQLPI